MEGETPGRPFSWRRLVAIAAIPALLIALGMGLGGTRGELWLGQNYDPSYLYLFGALRLAEGEATSFVDHPGVPVQLLGAGVLRLRHLVAGEGALRAAVLANPESALRAVTTVLFGLQVLVCLFAGAAVLKRTGSLIRAVLTQSSALLSTTLVTNLLFFKAEALLASLILLATAIVVLLAEARAESRGLVRMLAVLLGLAIASKITAAPFLLLLLLGPRRLVVRLEAMAIAIATLAAATLPWCHGMERFLGYVGRLAFKRGMYGRGESGLESPQQLWLGLGRLVEREPLLIATLVVGAVVWMVRGRFQPGQGSEDRGRWLAALVLGSAALLIFAAKQPNSRFVVPALAAVGPILALCFGDRAALGARRSAGWIALGIGLLVLPGRDTLRTEQRWRQLAAEGRSAWATAERARAEGAAVVPYFWASSPAMALWLGNRANEFHYAAELDLLHPGFVMFDVWRWAYRPFSGEMNRAQDLPSRALLLLHGKRFEPDGSLGSISIHNERSFLPPFERVLPGEELEPVWLGVAEAIYRPRNDSGSAMAAGESGAN